MWPVSMSAVGSRSGGASVRTVMSEQAGPSETPQQLTKEDIAKLPPWAMAALAARCALRAMPALRQSVWGPEYARSMQVVASATMASALLSSSGERRVDLGKRLEGADVGVIEAAERALSAASADPAAYAAVQAARSADEAATAAYRGRIDAATAATVAATPTGTADSDLQRASAALAEAYEDHRSLSRASASRGSDRAFVVPVGFFERPLWTRGWPEELEASLHGFQKDLSQNGLQTVWEFYYGFLQGSPGDWDALEKWIISVVEDIKPGSMRPEVEQSKGEEVVQQDRAAARRRVGRGAAPKSTGRKRASEKGKERDDPTHPAPAEADGSIPTAGDDKPAERDLLGRQALVDTLAAMFTARGQATPFTLALLGDWGSGKSTVVSCLKRWFKERAKEEESRAKSNGGAPGIEVFTADFNAWEYDQVQNIRAGLAHEVVRGLLQDVGWFEKRVLACRFAWREHRSGLWHALLGLLGVLVLVAVPALLSIYVPGDLFQSTFFKSLAGTGAAAGVVAYFLTKGRELGTLLQHPFSTELRTYLRLPAYQKDLGEIPVIKQHLTTLCRLRLGEPKPDEPDKRRLIVFVDDLDRCDPKRITDVFDAIRLIMDIRGVIVMVMIDPRIAIRAVADKYEKSAEEGRDKFAVARDYLGKIIQLPVSLRRVEGDDLTRFIKERLFPNVSEGSRDESGKQPLAAGASESDGLVPMSVAGMGAGEMKTPARVDGVRTEPVREPEPAPARQPLPEEQPPRNEPSAAGQAKAIEQEMRDTSDDVGWFRQLATVYRVSNPRQLLRLRNCYRFLKGLNGRLKFGLSSRLMLALLFWQEYLNGLAPAVRKLCDGGLWKPLRPGAEVPKGTEERVDGMRKHYRGWFKTEDAGLETARNLVKLVMLPYHDGRGEVKSEARKPKAAGEDAGQTGKLKQRRQTRR